MQRLIAAICALFATGILVQTSRAQYNTSFESPPFTAGLGVNGVDGWANGSGGGVGFVVSTDQASSGTQSLKSDNTTNSSFYSVRHDLGGSPGDPLLVSVDLWMGTPTQTNRLYGLYLCSTTTSTLGGTVLGLTIDGAGNIRGGTAWTDTYTNSGLFATADPGSYTSRWLTITLSYDGNTGTKKATISGLNAATSSYSNSWNTGAAPQNVNLGTDYFASTERAGIAYFDNLSIGTIPEPASLGFVGLIGLMALRRRR